MGMEPSTRIEPVTSSLPKKCSAAELRGLAGGELYLLRYSFRTFAGFGGRRVSRQVLIPAKMPDAN
jgi:hypothetical protein